MWRTPWAHSFLLLMPFMLGIAGVAHALTDAQYAALNTDITVTSASVTAVSSLGDTVTFTVLAERSDDQALANAYNALLVPTFWVWRTDMTRTILYDVPSADGTTWDWTQYIAQSQQQQNAWVEMFAATGKLNMSRDNVQAGINKIFAGTGGAVVAMRTHIFTAGRMPATRAEQLFCTACAGTTAAPGVRIFEGLLRPVDIGHALRGVPLP